MRSPLGTLRSIRIVTLVASAIGMGMMTCVAAAQNSNPPPKLMDIPNPTPRQPDLKQQYSDDPTVRAKQQQAEMQRNTQRRQFVVLASDKLVQMAQELKAGVEKHDKESLAVPNAMKAEQIETLAKLVKDSAKAQ